MNCRVITSSCELSCSTFLCAASAHRLQLAINVKISAVGTLLASNYFHLTGNLEFILMVNEDNTKMFVLFGLLKTHF